MTEFKIQDVEIHHLYNFYKDLEQIIDMVIVNEKQKAAILYQIESLMHRYFLYELPDDEMMERFKNKAKTIRKDMKNKGLR